jgi:hypothetical protein
MVLYLNLQNREEKMVKVNIFLDTMSSKTLHFTERVCSSPRLICQSEFKDSIQMQMEWGYWDVSGRVQREYPIIVDLIEL